MPVSVSFEVRSGVSVRHRKDMLIAFNASADSLMTLVARRSQPSYGIPQHGCLLAELG
jgi:hypothetical protein